MKSWFWGSFGLFVGHNSVDFHPILKIRTVLTRGHYYLQFGIKNFCFWWNSKFEVFGPKILTPISQWKMVIGGSNKDQLKDLEKLFPNLPKTKISLSPEKKWSPPLKGRGPIFSSHRELIFLATVAFSARIFCVKNNFVIN